MIERRFPFLNAVTLTGVVSAAPRVNRTDTTFTLDASVPRTADSPARRVRVTVVTSGQFAENCKARVKSGQELMIEGVLDSASARGGMRLRAVEIQLINERGFAESISVDTESKPAAKAAPPAKPPMPVEKPAPREERAPQARRSDTSNGNSRPGRRWNRRRHSPKSTVLNTSNSPKAEAPFGIRDSETAFDPFLVDRDKS